MQKRRAYLNRVLIENCVTGTLSVRGWSAPAVSPYRQLLLLLLLLSLKQKDVAVDLLMGSDIVSG